MVETFHRRTHGVTLVGVQVKAVVDRLTDILPKVEAETLSDTLGYMEKEALVDMPPKTVEKAKSDTLGERLEEMETKPLVEKFCHQTKH